MTPRIDPRRIKDLSKAYLVTVWEYPGAIVEGHTSHGAYNPTFRDWCAAECTRLSHVTGRRAEIVEDKRGMIAIKLTTKPVQHSPRVIRNLTAALFNLDTGSVPAKLQERVTALLREHVFGDALDHEEGVN